MSNREARKSRLAARVEAAADAVLSNRKRGVCGVMKNAWTDAARAASLAVRRAKAAERPPAVGSAVPAPSGAGASGAGVLVGGSGPGAMPPGVPPPSYMPPRIERNTRYEGRTFSMNGIDYVVRNGVLVATGNIASGVPRTTRQGLYGRSADVDFRILAMLRQAGVDISAYTRSPSGPGVTGTTRSLGGRNTRGSVGGRGVVR